MRRMREAVRAVLQELLARHPEGGHVHLNDLAEVIGTRVVTTDEIDALIGALETAGRRVGEPLDGGDVTVLREVLESVQRLRAYLGRRPTVGEIAADSGHADHEVRRALEHGAAASRPKPPAPR
jgi:hypothetical protein